MNLHPHPLTDPSELNFHFISSPGTRISADQSLQSLPDRILTIRPVPSMIVNGSCLRSVEHWRSNSIRSDSAPGIRTFPVWQASSMKWKRSIKKFQTQQQTDFDWKKCNIFEMKKKRSEVGVNDIVTISSGCRQA